MKFNNHKHQNKPISLTNNEPNNPRSLTNMPKIEKEIKLQNPQTKLYIPKFKKPINKYRKNISFSNQSGIIPMSIPLSNPFSNFQCTSHNMLGNQFYMNFNRKKNLVFLTLYLKIFDFFMFFGRLINRPYTG